MAEVAWKAGDELVSWCTKCRDMLTHRIKAIKPDGLPARVICNVCGGEHNYRPQPPKSVRNASKSSTANRSKKMVDDAQKWDKLVQEVNMERKRPYAMAESYQKDDVIEHNKFGTGIVTSIMDAHKMVVVFEDKPRIMMFHKTL
ncbi:MAG: hypothetical protein AAGJ35_06930 [Myxococcota bacterium]